MTRQVQVSASGGYGLGYHLVWCPKYRRAVLGGGAGARCGGLIRARAGGHGWRMVVLEVMPDRVHLFGEAHRSGPLSQVASQFKGFASRRLRAGFADLRSRLPALRSRPYLAATAGVVWAETAGRYIGTHTGRPWREERAR